MRYGYGVKPRGKTPRRKIILIELLLGKRYALYLICSSQFIVGSLLRLVGMFGQWVGAISELVAILNDTGKYGIQTV